MKRNIEHPKLVIPRGGVVNGVITDGIDIVLEPGGILTNSFIKSPPSGIGVQIKSDYSTICHNKISIKSRGRRKKSRKSR